MHSFKLSPSDFTFLFEECPRCFYLKVRHGFTRPFSPFPKMFTKIDGIQKDFFSGKSCRIVSPEIPSGTFLHAEKWVESAPIKVEGFKDTCFIRGKFDSIIKFDDGSYGVIDFKTANVKSEHARLYARQLRSYAYCLEHPAPNKFSVKPISCIGLIGIDHQSMSLGDDGVVSYACDMTWLPFDLDPEGFHDFLRRVMEILTQPEMPPAAPNCGHCEFRDKVRRTGY